MTKWLSENRQLIARSAGSLFAVILLAILVKEESGDEIASALKRISVWYFLGGILALFISRLFVVGRWHILLLSAGVNISLGNTAMITFTGLFGNNFLPTTIGGDVVRLAGVMQLGYDRAICLASLIADRLVGILGMCFTLPFGLVPVLALSKTVSQAVTIPALFQYGVDFIKRTFGTFMIWLKKPFALSLSFIYTFGNMAFIFGRIPANIRHGTFHIVLAGGRLVEPHIFCHPNPHLSERIWRSGTFTYFFTFKIWRTQPL